MYKEPLLVSWDGLRRMGWPYSRVHTWRMMKAGKFPQCFKLGDQHRNSHPIWVHAEVLAYFRDHGLPV